MPDAQATIHSWSRGGARPTIADIADDVFTDRGPLSPDGPDRRDPEARRDQGQEAGRGGTLADYILVMERTWVVEPVPASGGLTPTEALNDPKGKRLLLDLLEDFDSLPEMSATMRTARLRVLLGLS